MEVARTAGPAFARRRAVTCSAGKAATIDHVRSLRTRKSLPRFPVPTSTPSPEAASAWGVSSAEVHSVSISPEGRMRRTAPFGVPVGEASGERGIPAAEAPGATTA